MDEKSEEGKAAFSQEKVSDIDDDCLTCVNFVLVSFGVCVCFNTCLIVFQSRRVKEENPEVSGGYFFIPHCSPPPPPSVSEADPFGGEASKLCSPGVEKKRNGS